MRLSFEPLYTSIEIGDNHLRKKKPERQYEIPVKATFVVIADSLKQANADLEDQLRGLNTVHFELGEGQLRLPQIKIDEEELK
jgi:hypothetical protein